MQWPVEGRTAYGREAPSPKCEFGRAGRWEARAGWVGARPGTPQEEASRAVARSQGEGDWEVAQPALGWRPVANLPRELLHDAARRKAAEAAALGRSTPPEGGTGGWLGRIADHATFHPHYGPSQMGRSPAPHCQCWEADNAYKDEVIY